MPEFSWDEFAGGAAEGLVAGFGAVTEWKDKKARRQYEQDLLEINNNHAMTKFKQDQDKIDAVTKQNTRKGNARLAELANLLAKFPEDSPERMQLKGTTAEDVVDDATFQAMKQQVSTGLANIYKESKDADKLAAENKTKLNRAQVFAEDLPPEPRARVDKLIAAGDAEGAAEYATKWKAEKPDKPTESEKPMTKKDLLKEANADYQSFIKSTTIDPPPTREEFIYRGYDEDDTKVPSWMETFGMDFNPDIADSAIQAHSKRHFEFNPLDEAATNADIQKTLSAPLPDTGQSAPIAPTGAGLQAAPMPQSGTLTPEEQASLDSLMAKSSSGATLDDQEYAEMERLNKKRKGVAQ